MHANARHRIDSTDRQRGGAVTGLQSGSTAGGSVPYARRKGRHFSNFGYTAPQIWHLRDGVEGVGRGDRRQRAKSRLGGSDVSAPTGFST